MRQRIVSMLLALVAVTSPAAALDRSLEASLRRLDPEARVHQLCDIEMMKRIGAEHGALHPDRLVMDAETDAQLNGDVVEGSGGAVRSGGDWYRLSFRCRASSDGLKVLDLNYRVGRAIPRAKWEQFRLWD